MESWHIVTLHVAGKDVYDEAIIELLGSKTEELGYSTLDHITRDLNHKYNICPTSNVVPKLKPTGYWFVYEVHCRYKQDAIYLKLTWSDHLIDSDRV